MPVHCLVRRFRRPSLNLGVLKQVQRMMQACRECVGVFIPSQYQIQLCRYSLARAPQRLIMQRGMYIVTLLRKVVTYL